MREGRIANLPEERKGTNYRRVAPSIRPQYPGVPDVYHEEKGKKPSAAAKYARKVIVVLQTTISKAKE